MRRSWYLVGNDSAGFTLMEMLIIVAIIGLLGIVGGANFIPLVSSKQFSVERAKMYEALTRARR